MIKFKGYYIYCLFSLFLAFIVIYSIDFSDSGFILSYVGRLKEGQLIYKDFDYVRPFGSIVFWDILLSPFWYFKSYLGIIIRILFLIEVYILVINFYKGLGLNLKQKHVLLSTYILILHTFSLMPWHTVDGLFFLSFSFLFFNKSKYLLSIFFAGIAATTKQSFYLVFIIIFFLSIFSSLYGEKKKYFSQKEFFLTAFFSFIFLGIVYKYHIFSTIELFFEQTKKIESAGIRNFFIIGFYDFVFSEYKFKKILFFFFSLILILKLVVKKSNFNLWKLLIFGSLALIYLSPLLFINTFFEGSKTIFFILILFFFKQTYHNKYDLNDFFSILLLFIISWSSSLSWGYANILLSLPILLLPFYNELDLSKVFNQLNATIVIILFFYYRVQMPYFNNSILKEKYVINDNIPIYSLILMPEKKYRHIKEAQELQKIYKKTIYIPGNPVFDVMFSSYYNRSSWEIDVEYPSWKEDLNYLQKQKDVFFILDRNPEVLYNDKSYPSSFTKEILANKKLIDSINLYYIYN